MRNRLIMIVSILMLVASLFTGCKKEELQEVRFCAEYPYYNSVEEMTEEADLVVWGEILAIESKILDKDPDPIPHTVYTLKVEGVKKGKAEAGDMLDIKRLGGVWENTHYIMEGYDESHIKERHHYLFFLSTYGSSPAGMLNPMQTCYECEEDGEMLLG